MGPGSPPSDIPSAVERRPRVRVPACWALLSPGPTLPGPLGLDPSLWVSGVLCCPLPESACSAGLPVSTPSCSAPPHPSVLHPGPAPRSNTGGPACPGSLGHTARKSRWSLLYCHRLARRLEAALEDFSLSGLGGGERSQQGTGGHEGGVDGGGTGQPRGRCRRWGDVPAMRQVWMVGGSPVPLLLDEDQLSEPVEVEQVPGGDGTGHHQVVQHSYDVDQHVGRRTLLAHAARKLLNQVTHHLGGCREEVGRSGSQPPPALLAALALRSPPPPTASPAPPPPRGQPRKCRREPVTRQGEGRAGRVRADWAPAPLTHLVLVSGVPRQVSDEAGQRAQLVVVGGANPVEQRVQDALLLQGQAAQHARPLRVQGQQ